MKLDLTLSTIVIILFWAYFLFDVIPDYMLPLSLTMMTYFMIMKFC